MFVHSKYVVCIITGEAMSVRVQRLFRLCQSIFASSRVSCCPHIHCHYHSSGGPLQSCRSKSSSFILGQSEVLLQDGVEIQELPWVIRRLDPREFPFVNSSSVDGRRYVCGVKDEQFVQQLQECVTIHQVYLCLHLSFVHSLIAEYEPENFIGRVLWFHGLIIAVKLLFIRQA